MMERHDELLDNVKGAMDNCIRKADEWIEQDDDTATELVSLLCGKMAEADWVREAAAKDGAHSNDSGSLDFSLGGSVSLHLAFHPVGDTEGYWQSPETVSEAQWKAVMPEVEWAANLDDPSLDDFCGRLARRYQAYMPAGYAFRWRRAEKGGENGFHVMLEKAA